MPESTNSSFNPLSSINLSGSSGGLDFNIVSSVFSIFPSLRI